MIRGLFPAIDPHATRVITFPEQRGDACVARDHGENTNRRGQYVEGECQGKAFLLTKVGSLVRLSRTDFLLLAVKASPPQRASTPSGSTTADQLLPGTRYLAARV